MSDLTAAGGTLQDLAIPDDIPSSAEGVERKLFIALAGVPRAECVFQHTDLVQTGLGSVAEMYFRRQVDLWNGSLKPDADC